MTTIVSYGAGTNSTAMLIGLHERGERPDIILFADTGGERPETYMHIAVMRGWCGSHGFPDITVVAQPLTLEDDCLNRKALPGIAYGFKSCSERFKLQPQKKYIRELGIKDYQFWVGIDADETHRAKYEGVRYPLIEWGWGRDECVNAIDRAGIEQPGKSSCFFCPSMRPHEILSLKRNHPDLLARALSMEANAELNSIKGLGRSFSWAEVVKYDDDQLDMFGHSTEIPCGCYEGEE